MKKQKKPIIPILLLAVLFGIVAFMNKPTSTASPEAPKPADVPQEKKTDVAGDVASQLKSEKKAKPATNTAPVALDPDMKAHRGAGGPNSGMPSILRLKTAPQKPKPNDSSTSAQWYTRNQQSRFLPKIKP